MRASSVIEIMCCWVVHLALLVFVTMLVGCMPGGNVGPSGGRLFRQGPNSSWRVLYANQSDIFAYVNGRSVRMGANPAGYDSLDDWVGYDDDISSVVFYRPDMGHYMGHFGLIIEKAGKRSIRAGRCAIVPDQGNHHSYLIYAGKVWIVKGQDRKAELWAADRAGKWQRQASWVMPKRLPLPHNWTAEPAIQGTYVAFMAPSGYLLLSTIASGPVRVLTEGDIHYKDPGYEDSISGQTSVLISPSGGWVYFDSIGPDDKSVMKLFAINYLDGRKRTYQLDHPREKSFLAPPQMILSFHVVPGTRLIACEVLVSGMSSIALLDSVTGQTQYLPFMVERYQWCVAPQP